MNLPFIEIIEWFEKDPNLLMWKFPYPEADIKNGAKLIVRESEKALLLSEGKLADVFDPGTHTLATENIPFLTKLKGWKYGFQGPFKVDVYYLSSKQFVNLKWGTPTPIMIPDKQFGQGNRVENRPERIDQHGKFVAGQLLAHYLRKARA